MKKFDSQIAWDIIAKAQTDLENLPNEIKRDILGIVVGGDLARGDFIPNNSNILVVPLFSNRSSLIPYGTPAYNAVTEIFDTHFKPYFDCTESQRVWDNLTFDEIHMPVTAEQFDPPTVPQPHWHSIYLFDLIDHHQMIYGDDFVGKLYRPDPRALTLRVAAEILRIVRSKGVGIKKPPVGFGTLMHWQVVKLIRILQLDFSERTPTISRSKVLDNYHTYVPNFSGKDFGSKVWEEDVAARYPASRKEFSDSHSITCQEFIEEACELILRHHSSRVQ